MTATNHALTGALIGLTVGQPVAAVLLAIVSHFVLDALPHFSVSPQDDRILRTTGFRNYLVIDAGLCVTLVLVLAVFRPEHWLLASICAFLATSPDLLWINHFLTVRRGQKWRPNAFSRFAKNIQWFQRPIGWLVEVVWFIAAIVLLVPFLKSV